MNNIDYDELVEPIVNIYRNIETRLLIKIASAFKQYEEVNLGNSLEWYLKKVEELGGLNAEAVDIISKYSNIPKKEVIEMLKKAGYNIDLDLIHKVNDSGKLSIDVDKLLKSQRVNEIINNSYKELNKTFRMIQTKSISAFNDSYMNVLNEAYTSVSTGAYDYNTAISSALKDLTNKGIKVASYKQTNGKIRSYSIESTVRRDVLTAVVQNSIRSQLEIAKEMGAECVETSEHMGARDTGTLDYKDHSWWQGKVYKLEGSSSKYPNFQECCNFGDVQGIGGANCRHSIRPFIPGVSIKRPSDVDKEENKKQYELSQQQRAYERRIREIKRNIEVGKASLDTEKVKNYNNKFNEIDKEYNDFCKKNHLKRHYDRERIYDVATKEENKNYKKEIKSYIVGKFDISKYNTNIKTTTKDVLLLPERKAHILKEHKDVEKYLSNISDVLINPDNVYNQLTKEDTIWLVKTFNTDRVKMTIKLNTLNNKKEVGYKNSIIQFQIMKHSNIDNLIRNRKIEELTKK